MKMENKEEINQNEYKQTSQAERIKTLFNKHKRWMKTTYETAEFKEPIMFFERRSGEVEFYENATAGMFAYQHSDGTKRFIVILPTMIKKFGFADKRFRGYFCHEDYPLPLPQNPYITAEQVNLIVEKSLNDINKWKAKEIKAREGFWWAVLIGIALIILAIGVLYAMMPSRPAETTQAATTAATAIKNLTTATIIT